MKAKTQRTLETCALSAHCKYVIEKNIPIPDFNVTIIKMFEDNQKPQTRKGGRIVQWPKEKGQITINDLQSTTQSTND